MSKTEILQLTLISYICLANTTSLAARSFDRRDQQDLSQKILKSSAIAHCRVSLTKTNERRFEVIAFWKGKSFPGDAVPLRLELGEGEVVFFCGTDYRAQLSILANKVVWLDSAGREGIHIRVSEFKRLIQDNIAH